MKTPVLILGGGIAGLAAARILAKHGVATTVIEAKDRLGGRIHTVYENGMPIELGAEFVHGRSQSLLKAIEEAKLSTQVVPNRNQVFEEGKFDSVPVWELVGNVFNRIDPQSDDCSFDEFLERQSFDPRTRKIARSFVEGFDAARAGRISAQALLRAELASEQMEGSEQSRVVEGYGALVQFFERELEQSGVRVMKNACVQEVRWDRRHVEVRIQQDGWEECLRGKEALVTLPLGVLKTGQVAFVPSLPAKAEAIRKMEFGMAIRLTFRFRNPFWDPDKFFHNFDGPIHTWWGDARGPIVTGWAGGSQAEALVNASPEQLKTLGLEVLAQLFSKSPVWLQGQLASFHHWNWAQDPHVRGAYSYIPVNGLELPAILAAPVEGTLFFAGEATVADAQTGTVFGALESGERAAREILGTPDC